jgi:protein TonB
MAAQGDQLPDSRQLAKAEGPIIVGGDPALEALTLSQLESVLNPGLAAGVAAGGFAESVRLTSGGRIGGTSGPLAGDDQLDAIFSLSELDQQPRPVVQVAPQYPAQLRKRGVRGTVQVVFIVDQQGRVANPRIEKSTDPAFETPALEAVKKWKFEPGTKAGKRVQFKMRVPITFSAS